MDLVVALENIRSAHNVGSVFRTADAVGVKKIFLCGVTPAPIDKFGRPVSDIKKVALGAEKNILWEKADSATSLIKKLKKQGYFIIALEQAVSSIDYRLAKTPKEMPVALIIGSETDGVSKPVLKLADAIMEIPMIGKKESLNVSVAFGVAAYALIFGNKINK
jgi:tRNA G18 (ribose-2'-O)-methylase SpoU